MYFHKIDHPFNFSLKHPVEKKIIHLGGDAFRLQALRPGADDISGFLNLPLACEPPLKEFYDIRWDDNGAIEAVDRRDSSILLSSDKEIPFGFCGEKWLFCFTLKDDYLFYAMGEKNIGFEKSGVRTKFWNTDVWADFATDVINNGSTDPMYASFPVLLVTNGRHWISLMIPSPAAVFMDTGARQVIEGVQEGGNDRDFFYLGAPSGQADLVLCMSDTLAGAVSRMARLCGLPPCPPLWALGYHQSRWGYGCADDILEVDQLLTRHQVPCDAVWLDIDYMDEYRVFTAAPGKFTGMKQVKKQLNETGRRIMAILDPGVKADHTYDVCREGLEGNCFCMNHGQTPFVGFAWPGASYFPDFSQEAVRSWWAEKTRNLARLGFDGFWTDMNDPSTGSSEPSEMLFAGGTVSHELYHNVYGTDMARSTAEGLVRAYPGKRPFVVSRSGCLGSARYGAIWTGDNVANYHHLQKSIEMALSLSISTMPFIGNDVGGFGGDSDDELLTDWFRACMLFPLMRNHSTKDSRPQEPWALSKKTLQNITEAVQLRYALLPHLYSLFQELSITGEPILRPMIYESSDKRFSETADQFMIGRQLLQAPKLKRGERTRTVLFPEGKWLDLHTGDVCEHALEVSFSDHPIPLFLKSGAILPAAQLKKHLSSSRDIDLSSPLLILYPGACRTGTLTYRYDAGDGYGEVHHADISFTQDEQISLEIASSAAFSCRVVLVGTDKPLKVQERTMPLRKQKNLLPGMGIPARFSDEIIL